MYTREKMRENRETTASSSYRIDLIAVLTFFVDLIYLGVSSLIASSSDMDFLRKQGAISSSNKSPWHPVSVATFFFTDNGSR